MQSTGNLMLRLCKLGSALTALRSCAAVQSRRGADGNHHHHRTDHHQKKVIEIDPHYDLQVDHDYVEEMLTASKTSNALLLRGRARQVDAGGSAGGAQGELTTSTIHAAIHADGSVDQRDKTNAAADAAIAGVASSLASTDTCDGDTAGHPSSKDRANCSMGSGYQASSLVYGTGIEPLADRSASSAEPTPTTFLREFYIIRSRLRKLDAIDASRIWIQQLSRLALRTAMGFFKDFVPSAY